MRSSVIIATILALGAFAWVMSGQLGGDTVPANAESRLTDPLPEDTHPTTVRFQWIEATDKQRRIVVNGRTEVSRSVLLRAEIDGRIVEVGAAEGSFIKQGAVIARVATQDRMARLTETEALLKQREMEYKAATELSRKGFRADTKLAEARAFLDAAKAQVERMKIELSHTVIRAPFDGFLENRDVERGAYVKTGDSVATVVDLDPVLVVASVSEREVANVRLGQPGRAVLVDGTAIDGTVRYISSVADASTRSFRVELEIDNPDGAVRDGLTAELLLPLPAIHAHNISPAILTLADDGSVGVMTLDENDVARFTEVRILDDSGAGVWVVGLPERVKIITVGQGFVKSGQKVIALPDTRAPTT
jgi:multidrug efflux system membrane fusion protein